MANIFSRQPKHDYPPVYSSMDRPLKRSRWKTLRPVIGASAVFMIALSVAIGLRLSSLGMPRFERAKLKIAVVQYGTFHDFISVDGEVRPLHSVFLDSSEGGRVEKVFVEEGTMLHEGQPLLVLENPDLQREYAQGETQLLSLKENLQALLIQVEQSRFNYEQQINEIEYEIENQARKLARNNSLRRNGLISTQEYEQDQEKADFLAKKLALMKETYAKNMALFEKQTQGLEQKVHSMEENLKLLKDKVDQLVVRAPVDGQLTLFNAEPGQFVAAQTRLGRIDDIRDYRVRTKLNEYYLARIRSRLRGQLLLDDDKKYPMQVDKVYPVVKGGFFEADLVFTGKRPQVLRTGQSVRVELELGQSEKAFLLERGRFYSSTGGKWVYVLDPSGRKAYLREIRLGRQNPQYYEVLEGLHTGEQVIISSYEGFRNYQTIVLEP